MPFKPAISDALRQSHHQALIQLTSIPTVAGHESRVAAWITDRLTKLQQRHEEAIAFQADEFGNLHVSLTHAGRAANQQPPMVLAAHLDHPAFVVRRVVAPSILDIEFRGGVMSPYFEQTRVSIHLRDGGRLSGVITQRTGKSDQGDFDTYLCELDSNAGEDARPGDVATWDLPHAEIIDGLLHAPACDDLAGVAACLAAFEVLADLPADQTGSLMPEVRLLLTRAEEIGFIGAIAACRARNIPAGSRILMIENSRSFDDSPIGGGPIVRVGDRLCVFSPELTAAVCKRAEDLGGLAQPLATQKQGQQTTNPQKPWRWQRKLMPGGACEASVYQAYGYDTTCICLPLGNYHNMANLSAVQAGGSSPQPSAGSLAASAASGNAVTGQSSANAGTRLARIDREIIAVSDFDGLVDLLVACCVELPTTAPVQGLIEKLWKDKGFVLQAERV